MNYNRNFLLLVASMVASGTFTAAVNAASTKINLATGSEAVVAADEEEEEVEEGEDVEDSEEEEESAEEESADEESAEGGEEGEGEKSEITEEVVADEADEADEAEEEEEVAEPEARAVNYDAEVEPISLEADESESADVVKAVSTEGTVPATGAAAGVAALAIASMAAGAVALKKNRK